MYTNDAIAGLDELDNKILKIIEHDARLSYTEIAKQCDVTRVSIKKRMEALEEKGIIREYRTIIDAGQSDTGIKFFVTLDTDPKYFDEVQEKLKNNPITSELYISTGYSRLFAICIAPDSRSMREYVGKLYSDLTGVNNIGVNSVVSTVKNEGGGVDYEGDQSK